MKLLYVVNTRHDEEAYRVYARIHMESRVTMANRVISLLAGLLFISGGALAIAQQGPKVLYIASIIVGLLVLCGKPLGLWRMRRQLMKSANDIQTVFDYRFGDSAFDVSYPGETMSCPYSKIQKIVETEGYYFIYTDTRMAHILPKKDFSQGNAAAFGAFLSEKTGVTVVKSK